MNMVCNVKTNVELMVSMKGDIGVIQSQNIPIPGTTALQEVRFLSYHVVATVSKDPYCTPIVNKPYENEVTLTGQNLPLKRCQPLELLTHF